MSASENIVFVAAGRCMDGRTYEPFLLWLKRYLGPEFPGKRLAPDHPISEPGVVRMFATKELHPQAPAGLFDWMQYKVVDISKNVHHSKIFITDGHELCAGNPVEEGEHREHIQKALDFLKTYGYERIIGVYFDNVNALDAEDVKVDVVFDTAT